MDKDRKINFIKGFSKVSVNRICKSFNISRSNLVNGKICEEKLDKVYKRLVNELTDMIKEVYHE